MLTVLTASGAVSAKVVSWSQNLGGGLYQQNLTANVLMHLAKIDFSYDAVSGSPVAAKRGWKSFRDQMTPDEAAKYDKALSRRAPEQSSPYNTHNRYNADGSLKQTTTYDQYGRRHRQYDVNDGRRAGHQHNFEYGPDFPKGTRSGHLPISE